MLLLKPNQGIPRHILLMMSVIAGLTVANLYYNQPLLEQIRHSLHISEVRANLITVITQVGYALGLLLIVPLADMASRRHIVIVNMSLATLMTLIIAIAPNVQTVWIASLMLGACSVVPQIFIPMAGLYSRPEHKSRNMGYVLSSLLTGILAARVISGYLGEWLGWRIMFAIAAAVMIVSLIVTLRTMPQMVPTFSGTYRDLLRSVAHLFTTHPRLRRYSLRGALGFGSMMSLWSCLAFHLAAAPFHAGSNRVGLLGLCGMAGALAASGVGKYLPRYGIERISTLGHTLQLIGWAIAYLLGDTYIGLILAIIIVDIGAQCLQLTGQSGSFREVPQATNRANTIFMTSFFLGGSLGTYCAALAWSIHAWPAVCLIGTLFALGAGVVTMVGRK